jgi:sn-glycerol 3-phosphate transport system permease protein
VPAGAGVTSRPEASVGEAATNGNGDGVLDAPVAAETLAPQRGRPRGDTHRLGYMRRSWKRYKRDYLTFVILIAPNLILIAAFVYRPLFLNIYYSTLNWTLGSSTATSVGWGNYAEWFTDPHSWTVLETTAIFTVVTVGGSMVIGLMLALVLNRKLHGAVFGRATVFAPYVLSGVGVGLTWLFIFDPAYGVLGGIIRSFGGTSPEWYNSSPWALAMVMIVYVWKNLGYTAVIYLAGLQAIDPSLLEAADVDGASATRKLFSVKIPLLSPTTMFLFVTLMLSSLQSFDIIQIMTRGGPFSGTTTLMYEVYEDAFVNGRVGYSSTTAIILFVLLFSMTFLYRRFIERKVTYQ